MSKREVRTVANGNEYRVEVTASDHRWVVDEPLDEGGSNQGPSPVQALLGALVSCLTISFQFQARRKGVQVTRIEGWAASNELRWVEEIAVELQVWSNAPEEVVRGILPSAKRGCFVSGVLRPDLNYTVDLVVLEPEGPRAPGT